MSIWADTLLKELKARVEELEREVKLMREGANVLPTAQTMNNAQQRQTLGAPRR